MSKKQRTNEKRRDRHCRVCGDATNSSNVYCVRCNPKGATPAHRDKYADIERQ